MGRLDPSLCRERFVASDDVDAEIDSYMLCPDCGQVFDLRSPAEALYHSSEHPGHEPVDECEFTPQELEKRRAYAPLLRAREPAARFEHTEVRRY